MSSIERKNAGGVVVSDDVIVKIAEVAAKDVPALRDLLREPPISALSSRIVRQKPVQIRMISGAMEITMYITLREGVRIPDVCDAVQRGVKSSVQSMTGCPVTKVNIVVDDMERTRKATNKFLGNLRYERALAREQAFILVFEKSFNDESVPELIDFAVEKLRLGNRRLYGASLPKARLSTLDAIDEAIEKYCVGWKKNRIPRVSLSIMRVACNEIMFMPDIPSGFPLTRRSSLQRNSPLRRTPPI